MSILVNPVLEVFVPFEVTHSGRLVKRDDLPRFRSTEEVIEFLKRHPRASFRDGVQVKLQWIYHDEGWAIAEYHREVGKKGW